MPKPGSRRALTLLTIATTMLTGTSAVTLAATPASAASCTTTSTCTASSAPRALTGKLVPGGITATWAPPATSGGLPVTGYDVHITGPNDYDNNIHTDAAVRTVTVTDLQPGTAYVFTVTATNAAGTSEPITAELSSATAPTAPRSLRATMIATGFTATWSAPATTGGLPVTGYDMHITGPNDYDNTIHTDAATRTATVNGLPAGTTYAVTVTATNAAGTSAAATIDAATPTAPDQVRSVRATMSTVGQATVTWSPPAVNGGLPVTGYTATISPAPAEGNPATISSAATVRTAVFTGLNTSTDYTVTVTATSAAGTSTPASLLAHSPDPSSPVRSLRAATDPGTVKLTWSPPAATGGTPVTGYEVTQTDSSGATTGVVTDVATRTYTFTELGNGNTYTYNVRAINAVGSSPAATVTATTPVPPSLVRSLKATVSVTTAKVTVKWSAPASTGGETITGYRATISPSTTAGATTIDLPASARSAVFTDLGGHAHYTISVHAINTVGHGQDENVIVSFPAAPSEPRDVDTTSGAAGSATLTWAAPEEQGSTPVSSYRVTYTDPNGAAVTTTVGPDATSYTATGLTPGASYTFTVSAINSIGASTAGQATIVIPTVAEPVSGLTGTGSDQNVALTWNAPANDGGAPITGYRIHVDGTDSPEDITVTDTFATVSGLTNGVSYTFTVTAINIAGQSTATSTAATPFTVPDAVTELSGTAGHGTVSATWNAPVNDGGTPVTGYRIVMVDQATNTVLVDELAGADIHSKTVNGLASATTIVTTVNAVNAAGASTGAQTSATTFTAPAAVTNIAAVSGNSTVTVNWEAPSADGGTPVTGYIVTAVAGTDSHTVTLAADTFSHQFTNLDGTRPYTFTVTATNAVGAGTPVDISSTPAVAPTPVTGLATTAVTRTSIALAWSAPDSDGGTPVTGYTVTWNHNGTQDSATTTTPAYTITNLPAGTDYTVSVTATNAAGTSSADAITAATANTTPEVTGIAGAPYAYGQNAPTSEAVDQASGAAVASDGTIYVSRLFGISKIAPNGTVTHLAGAGVNPGPVVLVNDTTLYVAPGGASTIYKVDVTTGAGSIVAGANNQSGYVDGPTGTSRLGNQIWGLTADSDGNVYFTNANRVRRLAADGTVTTFAGQPTSGNVDGQGSAAMFNNPTGLSYDPTTSTLYVADTNNNKIRKIAADGTVTTVPGTFAGYTVTADGSGHFYTTPSFDRITRYNTDGTAGAYQLQSSPDSFFADGPANYRGASVSTSGHGIAQVAVAPNGDLIIPDSGNNAVRRLSNGMLTTIAGRRSTSGYVDATGDSARFNTIQEAVTAPDGTTYVSDRNGTIRKITPAGVVSTFAGNVTSPVSTAVDGTGTNAVFSRPDGITMDPAGNLYVADPDLYKIRKITPAGVVTTLVTAPGSAFSKLVYAPDGNLYAVAGNIVKKVTPAGVVSTVAAVASAPILRDIAYSPVDGSLLVTDSVNGKLMKVTTTGTVSTYKTGLANVYDVTVTADGTAYTASGNPSTGSYGITRIATDGTVTSVTDPNAAGKTNGSLATATFGRSGLGLQAVGDAIYVADREGKVIRKVQL